MASDLNEANNTSVTTSSSNAKSEKTENPNTPTLSGENSIPGLAGSGFEFFRDNVGVLLGFSVFSLLASELEVVPLALSASSRSEANGVFSEAVNKNKSG